MDTIIFIHIPKTGGSTFHSILNMQYKHSEIYNVFGGRMNDPEISKFIAMSSINKLDIKLLKGHMPFGLHDNLPGKCRYISFVRNPVERVISQYFYIKNNKNNPKHTELIEKKMDIKEFVSSGFVTGMNNGQCRFLTGDIDRLPFNQCDGLLDEVMDNIEKHFLWLGIVERFDESVLVLSSVLGFEKTPYYIKQNTSKRRKKIINYNNEDIELIKRYNDIDLELYKHANNILDIEIEKIHNFEEKLSRYKSINKKLSNYFSWLPYIMQNRLISFVSSQVA